jgi:hypothetical protein
VFGSCFAAAISRGLRALGYNVGGPPSKDTSHIIRYHAGINNTFAIRQQFEWAFENRQFSDKLWFNEDREFVGYSEDVKEETREILLATDVFIITLGLSEVWYNKVTQEVFWRAIPVEHFDSNIHGFRISTVEENRDNLEKIYSLIRKFRSDSSLILTLSPVPLVATFRPVSCMTASSVSKAILRVAADEVVRAHPEDTNHCLFYWPSYEIVKEYFDDPYKQDNRHIKGEAVNVIVDLFVKYFVV